MHRCYEESCFAYECVQSHPLIHPLIACICATKCDMYVCIYEYAPWLWRAMFRICMCRVTPTNSLTNCTYICVIYCDICIYHIYIYIYIYIYEHASLVLRVMFRIWMCHVTLTNSLTNCIHMCNVMWYMYIYIYTYMDMYNWYSESCFADECFMSHSLIHSLITCTYATWCDIYIHIYEYASLVWIFIFRIWMCHVTLTNSLTMGWLRSVGSIKLFVSFAE